MLRYAKKEKLHIPTSIALHCKHLEHGEQIASTHLQQVKYELELVLDNFSVHPDIQTLLQTSSQPFKEEQTEVEQGDEQTPSSQVSNNSNESVTITVPREVRKFTFKPTGHVSSQIFLTLHFTFLL